MIAPPTIHMVMSGSIDVSKSTSKSQKQAHLEKGWLYTLANQQWPLPGSSIGGIYHCQGSNEGTFFLLENQTLLTRDHFVKMTRDKITAAGIDASLYSKDSFRIWAASMASVYGVEDSLIKTLGHWKSAVYLLYIRIPRGKLPTWPTGLAK